MRFFGHKSELLCEICAKFPCLVRVALVSHLCLIRVAFVSHLCRICPIRVLVSKGSRSATRSFADFFVGGGIRVRGSQHWLEDNRNTQQVQAATEENNRGKQQERTTRGKGVNKRDRLQFSWNARVFLNCVFSSECQEACSSFCSSFCRSSARK